MTIDQTETTKRVSEIHELLKEVCQKMTDAYQDGIKIEFAINTTADGKASLSKFEAFKRIKTN